METTVNDPETIANSINDHLRNGKDILEIVDQIQSLPNPIVVDFNNVLANNEEPATPNKDAQTFIERLNQVGTIFVVTTARGWENVQSILEKGGLWKPGMVLITEQYLEKLNNTDTERVRKLIDKHIEKLNKSGHKTTLQNFWGGSADKKISFLFGKDYSVPIIDDSYYSTTDNPGMLGIWVEKWDPVNPDREGFENRKRHTLDEAAKIVEEHYAKIT